VLAVPPKFWPPPWPNERFHREALRAILPPTIYKRRSKAAFLPALVNRVRRQRQFIGELLESKDWPAERFVEQRVARQNLAVFDGSPSPTFATVWSVWGIATLQAWLLTACRYTAHR
jgi:Asparagine synthase